VPPPPGVRPWNWRRQQARAVARVQAMTEAQRDVGGRKGRGGDGAPGQTTAAEALLLAAEQGLAGSPDKVRSFSTILVLLWNVLCC